MVKILALVLLLFSAYEKPADQPIQISIKKIEGTEIRLKTLLPVTFGGQNEGTLTGTINKCSVSSDDMGVTDKGCNVKILKLHCGDATILVEGIEFQ